MQRNNKLKNVVFTGRRGYVTHYLNHVAIRVPLYVAVQAPRNTAKAKASIPGGLRRKLTKIARMIVVPESQRQHVVASEITNYAKGYVK